MNVQRVSAPYLLAILPLSAAARSPEMVCMGMQMASSGIREHRGDRGAQSRDSIQVAYPRSRLSSSCVERSTPLPYSFRPGSCECVVDPPSIRDSNIDHDLSPLGLGRLELTKVIYDIAHEHRPKSVQGMRSCRTVRPPVGVAAGYKFTPRSCLGVYIRTFNFVCTFRYMQHCTLRHLEV